jgi:hypothetical protein
MCKCVKIICYRNEIKPEMLYTVNRRWGSNNRRPKPESKAITDTRMQHSMYTMWEKNNGAEYLREVVGFSFYFHCRLKYHGLTF